MEIKHFFSAVLLIGIFIGYVIFALLSIRDQLQNDPSPINKSLISINCLVCLCLCVFSTAQIETGSKIDMTNFSFSNIIGSVIAMWFMGMIPAAALAVITSNIAMIFGGKRKRGDMPPGFEGAMLSGFHAMYIAMSYGIVLYHLGLEGDFFPFVLLP